MARPKRYAALVIGVDPDKLAAKTKPANVLRLPHGTVILNDATVLQPYYEQPGITMFAVNHYLDDDTFMVLRYEGMEAGMYRVPPGPNPFELDLLPNIEGETEPRAIARKLGIPEDFLFPT